LPKKSISNQVAGKVATRNTKMANKMALINGCHSSGCKARRKHREYCDYHRPFARPRKSVTMLDLPRMRSNILRLACPRASHFRPTTSLIAPRLVHAKYRFGVGCERCLTELEAQVGGPAPGPVHIQWYVIPPRWPNPLGIGTSRSVSVDESSGHSCLQSLIQRGSSSSRRRRLRTVRLARTSQHKMATPDRIAGTGWSSSRDAPTAHPKAVRFATTS
jgi:hypothetical protein